jgi:hypothetical protein
MSFNKIRMQPTKHYWKKHKNFKNTAYHLHTASNICKKKLECTNRNDCSKTWGSYNMHLALLTFLNREMQMFRWWDNNRLFWIIYIYIYIYIYTYLCVFYIYIYLNSKRPVVRTNYTFLSPLKASFFHKCAVHLGSPVYVPHAATTSQHNSQHNATVHRTVNEECVISRLCCRSRAVSCRWETQRKSMTKLSLFKNAFLLCLKMYAVQHNCTVTQNIVTQLYSHWCHPVSLLNCITWRTVDIEVLKKCTQQNSNIKGNNTQLVSQNFISVIRFQFSLCFSPISRFHQRPHLKHLEEVQSKHQNWNGI